MNDRHLQSLLTELQLPSRRPATVSITYGTDKTEPVTFKCDTTTTGDPYAVARMLLTELDGTAQTHARENDALTTGAEPTTELHRASVEATVNVAGDVHTVELDSTTNTDLAAVTAGLLSAAKRDLHDWLMAKDAG